MKNPFSLALVPPDKELCGREAELRKLVNFALDGEKVVLASPRRYGKTTLVKRALHELRRTRPDAIAAYCSISRETSMDGVATRVAAEILRAMAPKRSLLEKMLGGIRSLQAFRPAIDFGQGDGPSLTVRKAEGVSGVQMLEEVIGRFVALAGRADYPVCLCIDEFQTVATIDPQGRAEAMLRDQLQDSRISCFFVGSQRHMLKSMFSDSARPFYRMCHSLDIPPLDEAEMAAYVERSVATADGEISEADARLLAILTQGIPFFLQKLGYVAFQEGEGVIREYALREAFIQVVEEERGVVENTFSRFMPLGQRNLLLALAKEPTSSPYSQEYVQRHGLTSTGAITAALKALEANDYVVSRDGAYSILDPFVEIVLADKAMAVFDEAVSRAREAEHQSNEPR